MVSDRWSRRGSSPPFGFPCCVAVDLCWHQLYASSVLQNRQIVNISTPGTLVSPVSKYSSAPADKSPTVAELDRRARSALVIDKERRELMDPTTQLGLEPRLLEFRMGNLWMDELRIIWRNVFFCLFNLCFVQQRSLGSWDLEKTLMNCNRTVLV